MPQIIASVYEIGEQIGSGGGGVVYLGRHLRLGKEIVLKADKRTLKASPEVLRREVDALKDLSHQYIPQVYDFVTENDTVYTVMEYVEGESFDRLLKRGERFQQRDVIKWACQLLDALCYLHSRPPHGILHSDIKPANIMLTPSGDIKLIDFNIALALGEDGAVRVGYSQGYASPEHYGLDYSRKSAETASLHGTRNKQSTASLEGSSSTEVMPEASSQSGRSSKASGLSGSSSSQKSNRKQILLDVRSDIYSLGATLYHLLTGTRPHRDALQIIPIETFPGISTAVADIIATAMQPDPAYRYQTAREMLHAFQTLREHDPRTVSRRKHFRVAAAALAVSFLLGGLSTFTGLHMLQEASAEEARLAQEAERVAKENEETARQAEEEAKRAEEEARRAEEEERLQKLAEQTAKEALESVRSAEAAYDSGNIPSAIDLAIQALDKDTIYNSQAQYVLTDALGVYDLSDGFSAYRTLQLPAAPLEMAVSPDGTKVAVISDFKLFVYETESGRKVAELPTEESALADVVFLGENMIAYAAPGAIRAFHISSEKELWTGEHATAITCSGNGAYIAAVYKDEQHANVYDALTGELLKQVDFLGRSQPLLDNDRFADPHNTIFALNDSGTKLAVSFADGSLDVFDLNNSDDDLVLQGESQYRSFRGSFCGDYFAYTASSTGDNLFSVIDTAQAKRIAEASSDSSFLVQTDGKVIYLANRNTLVKMDPDTGKQSELAYPTTDIKGFASCGEYMFVSTGGEFFEVYGPGAKLYSRTEIDHTCDFVGTGGQYLVEAGRDTPIVHILQLTSHADQDIFSYDVHYNHDEARLSGDGSTVMLFRYDCFRIYAMDGEIIADVSIPDAGKVYDQQYRRDEDGSRLEVIYSDGLVRTYSATDGTLLSEEQGDAPSENLYEEFFSDQWKVTSPLHGAPSVYSKETGELICELAADDYLTYVTQVGEYVITEYTTALGERYGIILNADCEAIAKLPNLCDIVDGKLVFDLPNGSLRACSIYTLNELQELANSQ